MFVHQVDMSYLYIILCTFQCHKYCTLKLVVTPNTVINLEGNYVADSGAAIYVEVPPIHSIINVTNRACFMQYNCLCNDSLQDFPPQEWKVCILMTQKAIA